MATTGNMQTKNLSQYLHLYLGCEVHILAGELNEMTAVLFGPSDRFRRYQIRKDTEIYNVELTDIELILRPLSDIKPDEIIKVVDESDIITDNCYQFFRSIIKGGCTSFKTLVSITNSLRKLGFDCDGLIDAGLAIDKTKINH